MKNIDKHFGKLSSLTVLLFVISLKKLEVINDIVIGKILLSIFTILFFFLLCFFYKKSILIFKILFIGLLFVMQNSFISQFIEMVKEQNIKSSLSERNAAIGLSWIVMIPILLIFSIILGIAFDYLKSLKK